MYYFGEGVHFNVNKIFSFLFLRTSYEIEGHSLGKINKKKKKTNIKTLFKGTYIISVFS